MSVRKRVSPRRDRAVFKRTARKTDVRNIPGRVNPRGGICL